MAIVQIHPQQIVGKWRAGIALDLHTTSSTPIGENEHGHMQFDTVRPEIAELLYQLKYHADRAAAAPIIETAVAFLKPHRSKFNLLVPVPPSHQRAVQPVILLAEGIGEALDLPVSSCVKPTRPTAQIKNIDNPAERRKQIEGLYAVDARQTRGKSILLFDDLFRSGTTMNAITELLLTEGGAVAVRALTITKTRSNQ